MDLRVGRRLRTDEIVDLLTEARCRTLMLVDSLSDEDLRVQHDPLMSPLIWDLGHIGHFEEVWLLDNVDGSAERSEGLRGVYDPFRNPRALRADLPLPGGASCRQALETIRGTVVERLRNLDLDRDDPLVRDGFVFRMVLQHEYQHNETMLQTLQLKRGDRYRPPERRPLPEPLVADGLGDDAMVRFPGGPVDIGTDDRTTAYDNERPRHQVELAPFFMDVVPVTEEAYRRFVAAGGYEDPTYWSDEGRAWLEESGAAMPKHWHRKGQGWTVRVMNQVRPLDPRRPVCHVCHHEAEAYARFAGKRLPTEVEWEAAATWDPLSGRKSAYPWGEEPASPELANVDALPFQTAPIGTYRRNVSPIGCYGMIGDVWEWTSSSFLPYPGYRTFPYPEYSEVFFGDRYRVLRGGSWATRSGAIRGTFRNWDYPVRRQIFSGFRCAKDA